jgi:hypothetical protein
MFKKIVLFTGCFFALININAQTRKYANEFLNIGVGARGLGMSGAQAATVNDVTSTFWNPAGLIGINSDFQVGLMHSEYFGGISKYDYFGTAFPTKNKKGVIGLSLIRLAVDDIPNTLNIIQPDGTVDYSRIKSISSADYAGVITYAQKLKYKRFEAREDVEMNIGGNLKIIHRNVGELANAWGAGIDFGFQARVNKWKLGINAKDITTTYTIWNFSFTDKEKQILAQTGNEIVSKSTEVNTPRLVLGLGRYFPIQLRDSSKNAYILAETNFDITTDGRRYGNMININPFSIDPKMGLEFGYNNLFFIRSGIGGFQRVLKDEDTTNTQKRTMFQPTFGVGVKINQIAIDYAFSSLNVENNPIYSHFISLRLHINKKGSIYSNANSDIDYRTKKRIKNK